MFTPLKRIRALGKTAAGRVFRSAPDPPPDSRPKVFGIGFHKTGTTSLKAALTILGYRVTGTYLQRSPDVGAEVETLVREIVPKFDAFQDNPWPLLFKTLDREFPGSKFILTLRPKDRWIASMVAHFGERSTPMREWIYGSGRGMPINNEDLYVARYERHNREVVEFFGARSDDLLVFDMFAGEGWEKLCAFLRLPVPAEPFPWRNSKAEREVNLATRRTRTR